ncbi:MAG TPA: AraC family transcriptional regulator [Puia sp.]|nr:AraC family transcriptional regulator [Puia sp.]
MIKKEKSNIVVKNKINLEAHIKADRFRKEIRRTLPHKHKQYFEIVYLSKGKGSHWIDGAEFPIQPPVLFFINSNQTHHWEITTEPEGYVVILKHSFSQNSKDEMLKQLLQQLWNVNCVYCNHVENMENVFRLLCQPDAINGNSYSSHIADGLVKTLVSLILNEGKEQFHFSGLQTQLHVRYIDMLQTQKNFQRSVSHYASLLNTTPQNLNAACRKSGGQSAGEILDGFITDEAKRLLVYTDNNVTEIAYQLNFKDPSYFVKFFKKYQRITPDEYRKSSFQNYHL